MKLKKALELRKAKYIKRWKGKTGKWQYQYAKLAGKKQSLKEAAKKRTGDKKVTKQTVRDVESNINEIYDTTNDYDKFFAGIEKIYPDFEYGDFLWKEKKKAEKWVSDMEKKGYIIVEDPTMEGADSFSYIAVPGKQKSKKTDKKETKKRVNEKKNSVLKEKSGEAIRSINGWKVSDAFKEEAKQRALSEINSSGEDLNVKDVLNSVYKEMKEEEKGK